jgi:hypothetical protein
MPLASAPAIFFLPDGYQTTQADLMGLRVANRSFLQGLIRHGGLNTLHGYAPQQGDLATAFEQFARDLGATVPISMIEGHRLDQLAEVGGLFVPDPNLGAFARQRSFLGSHAYALTGVTHAPVLSMMADMVVAPVQPWDALVCTSRAVASALEEVLGAEEARLAARLGATRFPRPLLPVIPLGVDAADFASREEWRVAWRVRLGIAAEEVVVLYVGRLSRHGKAHPLPMLAALGRAARRLRQQLHLILAGWWLHPPEEALWREQAAVFCPEVRLHLLDGRDETVRREIRSAADMFTLLADNVQESFGLAPVEAMAKALHDGDVMLLENLRFHAEEEKNDPAFSRQLAALCDVYINDAFGTAHRAHASTEGITAFVRPAVAGFLMQKELECLGHALTKAARPYVAIVGGSKVSDKIELIENFLGLANQILIGGAMAYTFLRAKGIATGKSLVEPDKIETATRRRPGRRSLYRHRKGRAKPGEKRDRVGRSSHCGALGARASG